MEAVDVTTGVCVVVNTLPDRVTVMMGQLKKDLADRSLIHYLDI